MIALGAEKSQRYRTGREQQHLGNMQDGNVGQNRAVQADDGKILRFVLRSIYLEFSDFVGFDTFLPDRSLIFKAKMPIAGTYEKVMLEISGALIQNGGF